MRCEVAEAVQGRTNRPELAEHLPLPLDERIRLHGGHQHARELHRRRHFVARNKSASLAVLEALTSGSAGGRPRFTRQYSVDSHAACHATNR